MTDREDIRDTERDVLRDPGRDSGRDYVRDPARDDARDVERDDDRDLTRDEGRDPDRDTERDDTRDAGRDPGRDRTRDRKAWGLGVVLLGLTLAAGVQTVWTSQNAANVQECIANYSNQFADAFEARSAALNETQTALDRFMMAVEPVVQRPPDGETAAADGRELLASVENYLAARDQQVAEQQRKPLPAPPRVVCQ